MPLQRIAPAHCPLTPVCPRSGLFDRPSAISWKPGYISPDTGELGFGGWTWRYDLAPAGPAATEVTLTYDWSAVSTEIREYIQFPPFDQQHLDNSLEHLARLATEPGYVD